jgi:hypothetical protein
MEHQDRHFIVERLRDNLEVIARDKGATDAAPPPAARRDD